MIGCMIILLAFVPGTKEQRSKRKIKKLARKCRPVTTSEFFDCSGGNDKSSLFWFEGIYIIYNKRKRKYYVGQSVNVNKRLHQHFSGYGCNDVYHDFRRRRNVFMIRAIPLKGSGFHNLDDMERYAIAAFHAYDRGYNKTRGNGNS